MVRLENFEQPHFAELISWVESEEALMQFAGPLFKYPLTEDQLTTSSSDTNRHCYRIIDNNSNRSIGHAEIYFSAYSAKLGRILIGEKDFRGRGIGKQVINLLLAIAFDEYKKSFVELYVFDWNIAAIKCYEGAGFKINPDQFYERKIKDSIWLALHMTLHKLSYFETSSQAEDLQSRELRITETIASNIHHVWEFWSNPEKISHWWGPNDFSCTIHKMDFQLGGEWNLTLHGPDGSNLPNKSVFLEIIPQKMICFEHFHPNFITTVEFESNSDRTKINWVMLFESAEMRDIVVKAHKADEGLKQNLERLKNYLQKSQSN